MLKLAKLEIEIDKIIKFDVVFSHPLNNYLYNEYWVTELNASHFNKFTTNVEKLIESNIDYTDEKNIFFIKDLLTDITKFYEDLVAIYDKFIKYDFSDDLISHNLDTPISSDLFPVVEVREIQEPNSSNEYEDRYTPISEIMKSFFDLSDNDNINSLEELDHILTSKKNVSEMELDRIYAKAQLTYVLSLHIKMVQTVGQLLNGIVRVVNRRQSNLENKLDFDLGLENVRLNFNLTKTDLGHLFYNLYEIGIIAKDKNDLDDKRTELKNYLNSANIYYLDKDNYVKAQKMNRVMKVTRDNNSKVVLDEIQFLEQIAEKLQTRLESLNDIFEKLKQKGY